MTSIVAGVTKWFTYVVTATLLAMCMGFLTIAVFDLLPAGDQSTRVVLVPFFFFASAFMAHGAYDVLGYPTRIIVHDDGSVLLHSPLRAMQLRPAAISQVDFDSDGDCYLRYMGRKVDLRFFSKSQLDPFLNTLAAYKPTDGSTRSWQKAP